LLVSPNIGKILRAGKVFFCLFFVFVFSRDIANQDFAIFPVKVTKYILKVLLSKQLCITLFDKCQNGSIGHTGDGHFIHTVRHVHVLDPKKHLACP
jgi:hypothetical protein